MESLELSIQPGIISALLFIFLDILTVGVLDIVLSRLVCLAYYRRINEGQPISVRSADVPGLSNYLLGRSLSIINLAALLAKLTLLAVVLASNISIQSRGTRTSIQNRDATFTFDPTDKYRNSSLYHKVRRQPELSKACLSEKDGQLIYHPLRFILRGDVKLEGSDITDDQSEQNMYNMDDSSVVCMSPAQVSDPQVLVKVLNCTRASQQDCMRFLFSPVSKDGTFMQKNNRPEEKYEGLFTNMFVDFDQDDVKMVWSEYENPQLTCLTTEIGSDGNGKPLARSNCLLVSVNESANETMVESWRLEETSTSTQFLLNYPGILFEGVIKLGRQAAANYLEVPFVLTDYRSLSGDLVAQGAQYQFEPQRIKALERVDDPVTVIGLWSVGMVIGSVVLVLIGYVVTAMLVHNDSRPRFNTINGLSTIMREEHVPGDREDCPSKSVVLGLHFTNADSMHFGPLSSIDESTPFQDGFDIS